MNLVGEFLATGVVVFILGVAAGFVLGRLSMGVQKEVR